MLASSIQPTSPLLTQPVNISNLANASAQSEARFCTRQYTRRNSRQPSDFFYGCVSHCPQFMTGWEGCFRAGRFPCMPVVQTLSACHQSSFAPWVTGSQYTRSLSYDCVPYCHFNRQAFPFISLFCSSHPNHHRHQLPGSNPESSTAECSGDRLGAVVMIKTTRNSNDRTPLITIALTARQLAAIVEALEELNLIVRYSYNWLNSDDKRHAKKALKELRRSKALNLMEWAQFQQEVQG